MKGEVYLVKSGRELKKHKKQKPCFKCNGASIPYGTRVFQKGAIGGCKRNAKS